MIVESLVDASALQELSTPIRHREGHGAHHEEHRDGERAELELRLVHPERLAGPGLFFAAAAEAEKAAGLFMPIRSDPKTA